MNFAAKIVNNSNKAKPNHHRALFFSSLASPKVLSLGKENKNFVIYFAFHSLIRTFAAAKDVFDKYIINIG